ncbi:MAG: hypothetical protein N3H31_05570, partial [Candidatus Nezhaarchaeota archaeon]|nr:hypothetical protein [Candidatus Nezhaarchaeota archaeon]
MAKLTERFTLALRPSSDFDLSLTSSAYNFSWFYDGHTLLLPLSLSPLMVASVAEEDGLIKAACYGRGLSKSEAEEIIRFRLGLDEDLEEFYSLALKDPLLWAVPRKLRGMRVRASPPWLSFITALCQQNASFRQGWLLVYRVLNLLGRWVEVGSRSIPLPPLPRDVVEGGLEALRRAGLGFRASALSEAARLLAEGGAEDLATHDLRKLRQVKGVGEYTIRVADLFSARRYEEPPVDRWLLKVTSEAYGRPLKNLGEAERFIKSRWGRWGGLFAFFTTVVTDAEPGRAAIERVR